MAAAAQPRRAAFIFIFITVLLDLIALGMIVPVFPKLVGIFAHGDDALTSELTGDAMTLFAAMQFVFSPFFGALSDRFGRRPLVLMSNFGLGFDYLVMALAPTMSWLFVGRTISGITTASIPTAFAYITDVTSPDERPKYFGMVGAAFGIGFILGPVIGGLAGHFDPRLPFYLAAGLSLLNGIYGTFVLPESLPKDKRMAFSWKRANPVGSLQLLRSQKQLLGLAGVGLFANLAHVVLPSVFILYSYHRYNWTEVTAGLMMGGVGVCSMIVQGGLVGPIIKKLGERKTLFLGLCAGAVGFAIYAFAASPWVFCLGVPVMSLWGISGPALQGLMTRRVGPSEQGQLQGANQSLMAIAELVGPKTFTAVFAAFIAKDAIIALPGAPFLLATVFLLISCSVAVFVTRGFSTDATPPPTPSADVSSGAAAA